MKTALLLMRTKLLLVRSTVFERTSSAIIRNLSMSVFLLLLLSASYIFFYDVIFKYVVNLEDIGFLLIERLVSTGFLFFFFMLIISSFVTALATLFRSRETEYLFSTPVSDLTVFTGKFIDILFLSSWAILAMAFPILFAYAKIRSFGFGEYALTGFTILLPFVVIAASIGTILALVIVFISKRISLFVNVLGIISLFGGILYLMIHFSRPSEMVIPFTEDFRALNLFINNFRMNSHPLTPNFWLIQSLRSLVHNNYPDFCLYGGAMISTALFSVALLYTCAEALFFRSWLETGEHKRASGVMTSGSILRRLPVLSNIRGGQMAALIYKDILLFFRDPGQWAQLFLLIALLLLYFVNLRLIPKDIEIDQWRTIISIMNFVFCGLILATLSVRFVYTSYSLEGDSIWVLSSAPVSAFTLFREKFWISFIAFLILTECIALASASILNLDGMYYSLTIIGIFLMSITLTCLATGLGVAYPDFSERNPGRIASSPGGILTVVWSLFYITVMSACVGIPWYRYTVYLTSGGSFPMNSIIIAAITASLGTLITITVPLYMGYRALHVREF